MAPIDEETYQIILSEFHKDKESVDRYRKEQVRREIHDTRLLEQQKANKKLNWSPKINIENSLKFVCSWHKAHLSNENMEEYSFKQIQEFTKLL